MFYELNGRKAFAHPENFFTNHLSVNTRPDRARQRYAVYGINKSVETICNKEITVFLLSRYSIFCFVVLFLSAFIF